MTLMRQMTNNKDVNDYLKKCIKIGATYRNGKKHGKLHLPNGNLVVIAKSPSDSRAIRNIQSQIRRSWSRTP